MQKQFRSTMKDLLTTLSSLWLISRSLDGRDNCQPIRPAGSDTAGRLTVTQARPTRPCLSEPASEG